MGEMLRADVAAEMFSQRDYLLQDSDERFLISTVTIGFLTGADHSDELSFLIEGFDKRLDTRRLRNSFSALQAAWDNNGVIFFLKRITAYKTQHACRRQKDTYGSGCTELGQ
jgi:hypothetical protein